MTWHGRTITRANIGIILIRQLTFWGFFISFKSRPSLIEYSLIELFLLPHSVKTSYHQGKCFLITVTGFFIIWTTIFFMAFRAIPFVEPSSLPSLRWISCVRSFPRRSSSLSFLRLRASSIAVTFGPHLFFGLKDLSHHFFVGVGLAKRLQVIGDVGKTSEHVHFCFSNLACPFISNYQFVQIYLALSHAKFRLYSLASKPQ